MISRGCRISFLSVFIEILLTNKRQPISFISCSWCFCRLIMSCGVTFAPDFTFLFAIKLQCYYFFFKMLEKLFGSVHFELFNQHQKVNNFCPLHHHWFQQHHQRVIVINSVRIWRSAQLLHF